MEFNLFSLQFINSLEGLWMFFSCAGLIHRLRRYTATDISLFFLFSAAILKIFSALSWSCIEVLNAFVSCRTLFESFYMMHKKFYMHEILTAAGNFFKIATYKIPMQQTYFIFTKFTMQHVKFSMHISKYYIQSKFGHRDNLFISRIFYCISWKFSYARNVSYLVKIGHSSYLWANFWPQNKNFTTNTELK